MMRSAIAALGLLLIGWSGFVPPPTAAPEARPSPAVPRVASMPPDHRAGAPRTIEIPDIDVEADITRVGMADEVTMEVPRDIRRVGWFQHSMPISRDRGSTVLVGHRDGRADPNGVFRNLEQLERGDRLQVFDDRGRRWQYRVHSIELLSHTVFAHRARELFSQFGVTRLILLTCGGEYVRADGGYQANVVVTALPI